VGRRDYPVARRSRFPGAPCGPLPGREGLAAWVAQGAPVALAVQVASDVLAARAARVVLAVRDVPVALAVWVAPDVPAVPAVRVELAVRDAPVALVVWVAPDVLAAPAAWVVLAVGDVQLALALRVSGRLPAVSGAAPLGISAAGGRPEITGNAVRRAAPLLSSGRPPAEAAVVDGVVDGVEEGGDGARE
jgi:hypothetical protein